jgi:hypothetical protein
MNKDDDEFNCDKSFVIKQDGPTCWFNALLMALFYSDGMRKLLIPRIEKWVKLDNPKKIIKDLILKHHVIIAPKHIKFFENFKPEILLKELYKTNPNVFNIDPDKHNKGYFAARYFSKLLKYIDITDFSLLDSIITLDGNHKLFYSHYNFIHNEKDDHLPTFKIPTAEIEIKKYLSKTPEVLAIKIDYKNNEEKYKSLYPNYFYKTTTKLNSEIIYNNVAYVADSLIMSNFNGTQCQMGHQIAGVTCNKKRYMYNGWTSQTINSGISGELKQKVPCSLIPVDWLDYTQKSFCINNKNCGLYFHDNENIKNKQLCFSFTRGPRLYTYIRKDLIEPISKTSSPVPSQPKVYKIKECPPDKIFNPKSGRCVSKIGNIGKELSKSKTKSNSPKIPVPKVHKINKCPPDKILNPKSGRCVSKTGKIGKELLK